MNPADAAQTSRVLAIDIRPRRLGYFCIEGSNRIVESKAIRFTSIDAAKIRIGTILSDLCPSVLVLRRTEPGSRRDQPRTRIIQRLLRKAAGLASVRVVFVAERGSVPATIPLLRASNISMNCPAVLTGVPICTKTCCTWS